MLLCFLSLGIYDHRVQHNLAKIDKIVILIWVKYVFVP